MVSAGRLRPARKINQISQDVKCLVALGINGRFFAVSLRVTAADQIRIRIGGSFGCDLCGNSILFRSGQFSREHDQLKIRLIDRVERQAIDTRFLVMAGERTAKEMHDGDAIGWATHFGQPEIVRILRAHTKS